MSHKQNHLKESSEENHNHHTRDDSPDHESPDDNPGGGGALSSSDLKDGGLEYVGQAGDAYAS
jgi:hypothetical protein